VLQLKGKHLQYHLEHLENLVGQLLLEHPVLRLKGKHLQYHLGHLENLVGQLHLELLEDLLLMMRLLRHLERPELLVILENLLHLEHPEHLLFHLFLVHPVILENQLHLELLDYLRHQLALEPQHLQYHHQILSPPESLELLEPRSHR